MKIPKRAAKAQTVTQEHKDPDVQPRATETDAQAPATATTTKDRGAAYMAQLNESKALREQMLRELARGMDREQQLRTLDGEIADLEKRIAWIREAAELEGRRNSKEARAERFASAKHELQSALDDARALGKDA